MEERFFIIIDWGSEGQKVTDCDNEKAAAYVIRNETFGNPFRVIKGHEMELSFIHSPKQKEDVDQK